MIKFLCFIMLYAGSAGAQGATPPVRLSHYVLDSFTAGKVLLKSGVVYDQKLNYNALTGEMIFDAGGKYLAIAEPQNVDTVFIQGQVFLPLENKFYELLTHTAAPLFLEYTCTVQDPGAGIGYGTASNTTASASLRTLISSGGAYDLKLPDDFKVKSGFNYLIFKDGKFQKANNASQLSKIFPDKKSAVECVGKKDAHQFFKPCGCDCIGATT